MDYDNDEVSNERDKKLALRHLKDGIKCSNELIDMLNGKRYSSVEIKTVLVNGLRATSICTHLLANMVVAHGRTE